MRRQKKIYEMVCANRKQKLTENSCDFHILEDGCMEYIKKIFEMIKIYC